MMLTFLFFFAFVVNIGILVNAKINLQNAADMAAYAGAAVQARQLNQIAFLNYEMRRQYKKFIFRYYVMGNMSQERFPRPDTSSPVLWSPDGTQPYGLPVVCVTFKKEDNSCKLAKVPKIAKPTFASFDAITKVLTKNLEAIEDIRRANCGQMASANTLLLNLWLWNTDPDFKNLNTDLYDSMPKIRDVMALIQSMGAGIGLVPRELMLRQRINTLATYLNEPASKDLGLETVNRLRTQRIPEPPQSERKIQAFLSAYYTLGNHIFAGESIKLDELLPEKVVALKDINVKFDAYAIDFDLSTGDCNPVAVQDGVRDPLPVGVVKDPDYLTYYAVRLKAKAHLLFSPFGDVELTAYSAAQPFGSRIGPALTENDLLRKGEPAFPRSTQNGMTTTAGAIPNLPIAIGDSAAPGRGWDTLKAMKGFFMGLADPVNKSFSGAVEGDDISRAYHYAMAPNPWEIGKYAIPTDVDGDQFMKNFDAQRSLAIWAPIFPASKGASADSEVLNLLGKFMGGGSPDQVQGRDAAKRALSYYMNRLRDERGESVDQPAAGPVESFNVVRIPDPTRPRPQDAQALPHLKLDAGLLETDPHKLRTSWADVASADYEKAGRVGYSVKFISFETLQSRQILPNGRDAHKNIIPTSDGDIEADTMLLWH
ncbi:MAG: pilus assembly protein TadG-related protein [Oligoflexia bacterium]|nr:pilus assembly protein TadG-related protein [Oligoflexia bacterium]